MCDNSLMDQHRRKVLMKILFLLVYGNSIIVLNKNDITTQSFRKLKLLHQDYLKIFPLSHGLNIIRWQSLRVEEKIVGKCYF